MTHARDHSWTMTDIAVASVLAVVSGVVFWAWNQLWALTGPLFAVFPPAQGLFYGVWLVPGVLAMLLIRKPGAAIYVALLATAVSWLLGGYWGLLILAYGVLQGLLPELVFAANWYRTFTLPVAVLAGAVAGLAPAFLDRVVYYPDWSPSWTIAYTAAVVASSALIAGAGSYQLARMLVTAGAADRVAAGQDRVRV